MNYKFHLFPLYSIHSKYQDSICVNEHSSCCRFISLQIFSPNYTIKLLNGNIKPMVVFDATHPLFAQVPLNVQVPDGWILCVPAHLLVLHLFEIQIYVQFAVLHPTFSSLTSLSIVSGHIPS